MTEKLVQERQTPTPSPPSPAVSEKKVVSDAGASVRVTEYSLSAAAQKALNVGSAKNLK